MIFSLVELLKRPSNDSWQKTDDCSSNNDKALSQKITKVIKQKRNYWMKNHTCWLQSDWILEFIIDLFFWFAITHTIFGIFDVSVAKLKPPKTFFVWLIKIVKWFSLKIKTITKRLSFVHFFTQKIHKTKNWNEFISLLDLSRTTKN